MLVLVRVVRHPPDEVEPRRVIRVAKGGVGRRADGRTLVKGGARWSQGRIGLFATAFRKKVWFSLNILTFLSILDGDLFVRLYKYIFYALFLLLAYLDCSLNNIYCINARRRRKLTHRRMERRPDDRYRILEYAHLRERARCTWDGREDSTSLDEVDTRGGPVEKEGWGWKRTWHGRLVTHTLPPTPLLPSSPPDPFSLTSTPGPHATTTTTTTDRR